MVPTASRFPRAAKSARAVWPATTVTVTSQSTAPCESHDIDRLNPVGMVAFTLYEPAANDENATAPVFEVVAVPLLTPEIAIEIPGIHTSLASLVSSPSVSIHTVPLTALTELPAIGATVVDVVEVVVVVATGVVNERITPAGEPLAFERLTRK